jgi:N-acyl-L-homoserine lactone synthetase
MAHFAHNDMWLPVFWVFCECAFLNNEDKEVQTANAFDQSSPVYLLLPSASEIVCLYRMQQ